MAKHVIETLLDDLDDTEASETVRFGLDGRDYEIDLNDQHIDELHDALAPYIEAGRYADSNRKPPKPTPGGKNGISREEATAVRAWVRSNGGTIGDRGRIPKKFVDAYRAGDTSIFQKDDEQPEEARQLESVGAGDPFAPQF